MARKNGARRRTGDDLVREWVNGFESIADAERAAGLEVGHLRVWFNDSSRRLNPENALKLSKASGVPFIAIMFRSESVESLPDPTAQPGDAA